jgi:hypothetical protein
MGVGAICGSDLAVYRVIERTIAAIAVEEWRALLAAGARKS